jgi:hypothetical protein
MTPPVKGPPVAFLTPAREQAIMKKVNEGRRFRQKRTR